MRTGNWLYFLFYLTIPFKCKNHLRWEGKACWYWVKKRLWTVKTGFDDASQCLVMQKATGVIAYLFTANNGQGKWKTFCPTLMSSFVNWVVFIVTLLLFLMGSSEAYKVQCRPPSVYRAIAKDIHHHPNSYANQELDRKLRKHFLLVTDCSCNDRTYEIIIWCKGMSSSLKKKFTNA